MTSFVKTSKLDMDVYQDISMDNLYLLEIEKD